MVTIIRGGNWKDIVFNSESELVSGIQKFAVQNFKGFTEHNQQLLSRLKEISVFNSPKDFSQFFKKERPRKLYDLYSFWGYSPEEIEKEKVRQKEKIERAILTKVEKSGLTRKEYFNSQTCLRIEFWLRKGYSEEDAQNEISKIQSGNSKRVKRTPEMSPRCLEYWTSRGHSVESAKISRSNFQKQSSPRCVEYWMSRGLDYEDALQSVKKWQSKCAKAYHENVPLEERRKRNHLCQEYWQEQGLSKDQIKQKLSDNGYTFSYQICVDKYGKDLGFEIWKARQEKWQNTLNQKSPEEIAEINSRKSPAGTDYQRKKWEEYNVPGVFYLVEFDGHTKVGITINSLTTRYGEYNLDGKNTKEFHLDDVFDAYTVEQLMIHKFSERISKNDYGPFGWTEVIRDSSITELLPICESLINNLKDSREQLKELQNGIKQNKGRPD